MKKVKAFTTKSVDGFPDGHPLQLRAAFQDPHKLELMGHRTLEGGVVLVTLIPATPENFENHVRVIEVEEKELPAHPRGF